MKYDIFISYSRKDNENGRITELKNQIEKDYFEFTKEKLNVFFDLEEIKGMEDWRHRLLQGLKDSHILLLILSPHYISSSYCEWEVIEYLKYEYSRAVQGEGVAQIYFLEIPGLDSPEYNENTTDWVKKISTRQRIDLRPWYDEGTNSLKNQDVKKRLEELKSSLYKNIKRIKRLDEAEGNLPAPNTKFVGRQTELKKLHDGVGLGKFGSLAVVYGMGGLGKTTIAFQYAYAYADFYPGGRWFVNCTGEKKLASVIRKLDIDLGIEFTDDEKKDDVRAAKKVLNHLLLKTKQEIEKRKDKSNPPEPAVLLILDNVDFSAILQPPNTDLISGKQWLKILTTTRLGPEDLGIDEKTQPVINIDKLPDEDGISLIESHQPNNKFTNDNEREKAKEIVKLLGGFTLAIEITGVFLRERKGKVSCATFLEMLKKEGGVKGIDFIASKTKTGIPHVEKLVSATLEPTLELLSDEEKLILSYASMLPPDNIVIPWLQELVKIEYPELGEDDMSGIFNPWLDLIDHLIGLSLLHIVERGDDNKTLRIVKMHRLLQEFIIKEAIYSETDLLDNLTALINMRAEYLNINWKEKQNRWEIQPIAEFSFLLLNNGNINIINIANKILGTIYELGNYSLGERLSIEVVKLAEKIYKSNDPVLAQSYNRYALIEMSLGKFKNSKELYEKALNIFRSKYGPNNPELIESIYSLSYIEQSLGNLENAKKLINEAISICNLSYGPNNSSQAQYLTQLANIEYQIGNLNHAKEIMDKVIGLHEKNHEPKASAYNTLSLIEHDLGNLTRAQELQNKAVEIRELILEPNHPYVATGYNNLALIERDLGNFSEAKELIERAITIEESVYEPNHSSLLSSYFNLAKVERDLGNINRAKELFETVMKSWESNYKPDHPYMSIGQNYLALVEIDLGNLNHAKELIMKALTIESSIYGSNNYNLTTSYFNLAKVEQKLGNLEEAEGLLRKTLDIREEHLPVGHYKIIESYLSLINLLEKTNKKEEVMNLGISLKKHESKSKTT